jgi:hypothetical protein
MKLTSLIGKEILDIFVKIEPYDKVENIDLLYAECYFVLTDNLVIGLPFHIDDNEVWIKELNPTAKSYFPRKKWWQRKQEPDKIRGYKIKDIIHYPDEMECAFIELENGIILTEESVLPVGLAVGLRTFDSIQSLEETHGKNYIRLTNLDVSL